MCLSAEKLDVGVLVFMHVKNGLSNTYIKIPVKDVAAGMLHDLPRLGTSRPLFANFSGTPPHTPLCRLQQRWQIPRSPVQ